MTSTNSNSRADVTAGARNLVFNCAELKAGETLLLICEDPALGWYSAQATDSVVELAKSIGVTPTILVVGGPSNEPDAEITRAIANHDCTIYFARLGDQGRFDELPEGKRSVMCYTRNEDMLASMAGRLSYGSTVALKTAIDSVLADSSEIEIVCPLGTLYSGSASKKNRSTKADVSVRRFPLGVHMPIDGSGFSGRVALSRFLTPTGSKCYTPDSVALDGISFAVVAEGRITGLEGEPDQVALIEEHYDMVSSEFDIDRDNLHSWHGGIHAGLSYSNTAESNPDRWSNTVFMNPRTLHFHTCGDYAPAEISWLVSDQTVAVDGVQLWADGRLDLDAFEATRICKVEWPELAELYHNPEQAIGI